jgi:hypothetical protein
VKAATERHDIASTKVSQQHRSFVTDYRRFGKSGNVAEWNTHRVGDLGA